MKLPWVSREVFDAYVSLADKHEQRRADALSRANNRYESLVQRMLEMKREGFKTVPLLTEPLKPAVSALAPEVEFAVENKASGDPSLRRYLNKYAQTETAKGTDPSTIVRAIKYGDDADDEGLAD